ncbi:MAG: hypothetical protein ABR549_15610 [Mycobacteriales bacterium]
MSAEHDERAYDIVLDLADYDHEAALELLALIRDHVCEAALLTRWDEEHETNGAGRIEARIYQDEEGSWIADPKTGFSIRRRFATQAEARAWIRSGGHYVYPGDPAAGCPA